MEKKRGFEIAKGFENANINLPVRSTKNSAGYDIEAAEDVVIPSFKRLFSYLTLLLPRFVFIIFINSSIVLHINLPILEAEPENEEYIKDLVKWGKDNFDCIIFVTDRYDDKPAVKNFAAECDYTIATPLANVDDIEACKDYYECFGGRVLYAAWEFSRERILPEESIRLIVGEDNYLGAILRSDEKNYRRNFAGKIQPIFMTEAKEEQAGYVQIINRIFRIRNFQKRSV